MGFTTPTIWDPLSKGQSNERQKIWSEIMGGK